MSKDLAGFDYSDYYQWEWTGFQEPANMQMARGFWIATPQKPYMETLPCLHVNETLKDEEYWNVERTYEGRINDNMGVPATYRMKAWVCMEMMMSFSIMTSKRMETKNWLVSTWNRLFHEQGLIELHDNELKQMKSFELHIAGLPKLSHAPRLQVHGHEQRQKAGYFKKGETTV